jgi:hypothetical protein
MDQDTLSAVRDLVASDDPLIKRLGSLIRRDASRDGFWLAQGSTTMPWSCAEELERRGLAVFRGMRPEPSPTREPVKEYDFTPLGKAIYAALQVLDALRSAGAE